MNGSLDGMIGSSATSDRFFKHVPEMRSQYGSLYPASYYRLEEADEADELKRQIEAQDKKREAHFSNFAGFKPARTVGGKKETRFLTQILTQITNDK